MNKIDLNGIELKETGKSIKNSFISDLLADKKEKKRVFSVPILMHFAARFNKTTYGKFASDYKVLVESNIRAMEDFDTDTGITYLRSLP